MEGEGEADRKEESAEPRGGGGAKAVDGEAETEADRRCEVGAELRCRAVGEQDWLSDVVLIDLFKKRSNPALDYIFGQCQGAAKLDLI